MSKRFDKLVGLLRELFQLDQPDLDFGFYRIMHAKSAEVPGFLERDLLPQVKADFAAYQPADKAAIEKELAKAVEQATGLGVDPTGRPCPLSLRRRPASQSFRLRRVPSLSWRVRGDDAGEGIEGAEGAEDAGSDRI